MKAVQWQLKVTLQYIYLHRKGALAPGSAGGTGGRECHQRHGAAGQRDCCRYGSVRRTPAYGSASRFKARAISM